jgi:peroxiredoxin
MSQDLKIYDLSDEDQELLSKWRHFRPQADQHERYIMINRETRKIAKIILERCPKSAERTLALRRLEEARQWATNAIMRNEEYA